jgi:hypothetical protein
MAMRFTCDCACGAVTTLEHALWEFDGPVVLTTANFTDRVVGHLCRLHPVHHEAKNAGTPARGVPSKARPAERHLGVLWKPQRFVQLRIVKNVPKMIDDHAISPKLIRKHKLDRSQHERKKCVIAVQQRGFYRRRTDEIA